MKKSNLARNGSSQNLAKSFIRSVSENKCFSVQKCPVAKRSPKRIKDMSNTENEITVPPDEHLTTQSPNLDSAGAGDRATDSPQPHPIIGVNFIYPKLNLGQRIVAGSGHVLNDLCASLWFTYLLIYFQKVVQVTNNYAAYLLLLGQVSFLNKKIFGIIHTGDWNILEY